MASRDQQDKLQQALRLSHGAPIGNLPIDRRIAL
jgi:hypothetical protein